MWGRPAALDVWHWASTCLARTAVIASSGVPGASVSPVNVPPPASTTAFVDRWVFHAVPEAAEVSLMQLGTSVISAITIVSAGASTAAMATTLAGSTVRRFRGMMAAFAVYERRG